MLDVVSHRVPYRSAERRSFLHLGFCEFCLFIRLGSTNDPASSGYVQPKLGVVMRSFRVFLAVFSCHLLCGLKRLAEDALHQAAAPPFVSTCSFFLAPLYIRIQDSSRCVLPAPTYGTSYVMIRRKLIAVKRYFYWLRRPVERSQGLSSPQVHEIS
jgi:hypothetical protein